MKTTYTIEVYYKTTNFIFIPELSNKVESFLFNESQGT